MTQKRKREKKGGKKGAFHAAQRNLEQLERPQARQANSLTKVTNMPGLFPTENDSGDLVLMPQNACDRSQKIKSQPAPYIPPAPSKEWEVEGDDGWIPLPRAVVPGVTSYTCNGADYEYDFTTCVQTRVSTGKKRTIRKIKQTNHELQNTKKELEAERTPQGPPGPFIHNTSLDLTDKYYEQLEVLNCNMQCCLLEVSCVLLACAVICWC